MEDFFTLRNQLCFALYETSSEMTKLYSSMLQEFGLTYPQYLVLLVLWEKDGVTVKELGQTLGLGTGTLTPMVVRMEAGGWLRKIRSKEDERNVHIYLQPKAQEGKTAIVGKVAQEVMACRIELKEYEELMKRLNQLQLKLKSRK